MLKSILLHTLSSHNLVHMLCWFAGNLSLYHLAVTLPPITTSPVDGVKLMVLHFLTGFPIWPDDCRLAIGMKPMVVKECNVWLAPMCIYIYVSIPTATGTNSYRRPYRWDYFIEQIKCSETKSYKQYLSVLRGFADTAVAITPKRFVRATEFQKVSISAFELLWI